LLSVWDVAERPPFVKIEAATKLVPSAKDDSVGSTSEHRHWRAGLSYAATSWLRWPCPTLVHGIEFRNEFEEHKGWATRV